MSAVIETLSGDDLSCAISLPRTAAAAVTCRFNSGSLISDKCDPTSANNC